MKSRKNIIIVCMLAAVLLMAIVYAAFSTQLSINATGNITGDWNIYFASITEGVAGGNAKNNVTPTVQGTTATVGADFYVPGDSMTYEIVMTNGGDIGAIIQNINVSGIGDSNILYTVDGINVGDKLAEGASITFTLKIEFDSTATSIPMDASNSLTLTVTAVQDQGQVLNQNIYTVKYNANGGKGTMTNTLCISDQECTLSSNAFTKEGYDFLGWAISENGSLMYNDAQNVTNLTAADKTITLYAVWGRIYKYPYTGTIVTFVAAESGNYKLEVWGGKGGDCSTVSGTTTYRSYGGKGGYSSGYIELEKGEELFVVVGGAGTGTTARNGSATGGYNGGGDVTGNTSVNHVFGAGGGATHIATATGLLSNLSSNRDAVLIVAGGGGGSRNQANHVAAARYGNGGAGGGLSGVAAIGWAGDGSVSYTYPDSVGTQTTGYAFGQGQTSKHDGAGGSGWYGGYNGINFSSSIGVYYAAGSGGSGYLSSSLTDTIIVNGDTSMPNHSGTSTMIGNNGDGYAKITYYPY